MERCSTTKPEPSLHPCARNALLKGCQTIAPSRATRASTPMPPGPLFGWPRAVPAVQRNLGVWAGVLALKGLFRSGSMRAVAVAGTGGKMFSAVGRGELGTGFLPPIYPNDPAATEDIAFSIHDSVRFSIERGRT